MARAKSTAKPLTLTTHAVLVQVRLLADLAIEANSEREALSRLVTIRDAAAKHMEAHQ